MPECRSRREFLKTLAGTGAGIVLSSLPASSRLIISGSIEAGVASPFSRGFDPLTTTSVSNYFANLHIFEALVNLHPVTRQFYLGLAGSEPVQKDRVTWQVTIREGASFHNGQTVTVEDVVYSFRRVLTAINRSPFLQFVPHIRDVEAIDDVTVEFKLNYFCHLFKERLSLVKIVPRELLDRIGPAKFDLKPVGSGPYKFIRSSNDHIVFVSHNTHNGKYPPLVKNMTWLFLEDDEQRVKDQESGLIQATEDVPETTSSKGEFKSTQSSSMLFLMFNCEKHPFNDKRVRQAFHYAIDKNSLINSAMRSNAEQASSYLHAGHRDYIKASTQYHYDPKKAQNLLTAAGISKLDVKIIATEYPWIKECMAQIISSLTKIPSLAVSFEHISPRIIYGKILPEGDFSVLIDHGGIASIFGDDLDLLLSWYYKRDIWTKYRYRWSRSPEYNKVQTLLDKAFRAETKEESKTLWAEVINIVADQVPLYPIFHRRLITGWNDKYLSDFQPLPTPGLSFLGVDLKDNI